jgi:transposase-like protein
MTQKQRYRCLNCGEKFEIEVLTDSERRDAKKRNIPVYAIACPKCRRTDVSKGWN